MVWTYHVAMEQYRKSRSEKRTRIVGMLVRVSPGFSLLCARIANMGPFESPP